MSGSSGSDIDFGPVGISHGDGGGAKDNAASSDIELGGSDVEFADVQAGSDNSDIDFAPGAASPTPAPTPVVRRRRRLPKVQTSGTFWAYVITKEEALKQDFLICLAQIEWRLVAPNISDGNLYDCGTLYYFAQRVVMLEDRVGLPDGFLWNSPVAPVRARNLCGSSSLLSTPTTVNAFLASEKIVVARVLRFDDHATIEALLSFDQGAILLRSLPIHKFRALASSAIPDQPRKAVVKRWRAAQRDAYKEAGYVQRAAPVAESVDFLTYLPPWVNLEQLNVGSRDQRRIAQEIDPIRLVDSLAICQHLKTTRAFQEVIDDVVEYLSENNPIPGTIQRRRDLDPARTSLMVALARSDVVAMNLTRRFFRKWRVEDSIKSIHIYSDASPIVGYELQGMLIDVVFKAEDTLRLVLPGSTLSYGHTDTLSKGVALVHALWLISGSSEADLAYCCSNVRSLTTDFGVEMHLLEVPDISTAYIAFLGGTPMHRLRPLVRQGSRLFAKALRMAGWSHSLGNLMKAAAERFPRWPLHLSHMRTLCAFFRNPGYRDHIKNRLGAAKWGKSLRGFTATFAKWRYETVPECQRQLKKQRLLCEQELNAALFSQAQDPNFIRDVMAACRDGAFWRWLEVSLQEIFWELELLRKWGMVCDHPECEELRKASNYRKKIECPRTLLVYTEHLETLSGR